MISEIRSSIYIPSARIEKPIEIKKTKVNIEVEIDSLDDLLKLINDYPLKYDVEYNINMKAMHGIFILPAKDGTNKDQEKS